MAKFTKAICSIDNTKYNIDSLDKLKNGDPVLDDLHCEKCGCRLIFHHSGKRAAYLATAPGCDHSEGCKKQVRREEAKERIQRKYVSDEPLTRSQQKRLAKSGYNTWINGSQRKNNKKPNGSSKKVTKNSSKSVHTSYRPIAGGNGNILIGNKNQKLHTRTPLVAAANIANYVGQAIKVVGIITEVKVFAYGAIIRFIREGIHFNVQLNEATFRNSAEGLGAALKALNYKIVNQGFEARACAIVDVIPNSKRLPVCMLRTDDGLAINGDDLRVALR